MMGRRDRETDIKEREIPMTQVPSFNLEKKMEAIKTSKLPDKEKEAFIARLTASSKGEDVNAVTFDVYVRIKKVRPSLHPGMLAYPKVKGVKMATVQQWDEIFRNF
jgi:hypothetical protein